ncbi:MAG: hypothetical protein E7414_00205 [Ruminococcaceae bacterium]|nr:hypothetical protein [Oscillospiraceae bacterium]
MVTLSIKERGNTISSLIKAGLSQKKIGFSESLACTDCDYIFLPPDAKCCDIALAAVPGYAKGCRADYMTILNTDEKITEEVNKKSLLITYGLNPLATVTASSIRAEEGKTAFSCCLQRSIVTLKGKLLEPQEFPVSIPAPLSDLHAGIAFAALGLVLSFAPEDFSLSR